MPVAKAFDSPTNNSLLAVLPRREFENIVPELEHQQVESGKTLCESGEKADYIYFPTSCLISLNYESDNGTSISIATIGRNGIVGTGVAMGNVRSPDRAIVQYNGCVYRMKAASVENELAECGDFQALLMTYTQALMTKISQNAICNRLHRIDQQVCRVLLEFSDELRTDVLKMTHDLIAGILGVRRESVSLAAGNLQKRQLITATRGEIRITNQEGLLSAACECYSVAKDHLKQCLEKYSAEHTS